MDQEKAKIRERSRSEDEPILLLEKGKRGVLNVVFGRTMFIVLMLAAQILLLILGFSRLARFFPYIYGLQAALSVALVLRLVNKSGNPSFKVTWILLIALVPVVGVSLYLFVETDLGHRVLNRRLSELLKETEVVMERPAPIPKEELAARPDLAGLAGYVERVGGYPAYADTDVDYFDSGEASLEAMLRDLKQAKDFIFLEFFIIDEGYMWGRVLKVLEDKVRQGVEVRVLYDGTCALFRLPYRYPEMLKKLGIQCKMFSPLRPLVSTYYNNRDHRKIVVVDGRVAYTGGVNLADEYMNRKKLFGHWKDVSLRLEGEAVRSFTLMFLRMWNIDTAGDGYRRYLSATKPLSEPRPGWVLPYGDSPLDSERVSEMVYLDIISRAERYVHIMTPYLILDQEMLTALCFAAKRGVDVAILLPHIPDKRYAFALAKTHYRELLESGVRILEYTPGFVHAKVFVSDDCKAVVGTVNLDWRSLYLHFECAVYLRDVPAVADIEADFEAAAARSQERTLESLKDEKWLTRVAGWVLKVFAPVM